MHFTAGATLSVMDQEVVRKPISSRLCWKGKLSDEEISPLNYGQACIQNKNLLRVVRVRFWALGAWTTYAWSPVFSRPTKQTNKHENQKKESHSMWPDWEQDKEVQRPSCRVFRWGLGLNKSKEVHITKGSWWGCGPVHYGPTILLFQSLL